MARERKKVGELQFGWIDFSKEQRNKVMSVINLLTEPDAVDELGIGMVRDGFANIFFPGTSTIQTRAKYFLLTPYLLNELERQKGITPEKFIKHLNHEELNMIDTLKMNGEKGIIGETAGRKLKRKPSDIYWNGIRAFGIFTGGKISLHEYARIACHLKDKKHEVLALGNQKGKEDEVEGDDQDAYSSEFAGGFWRLPNITNDWKSSVDISLTFEEAVFLKNRIYMSFPDTMMGEVLDKNLKQFNWIESFDDLEAIIEEFSDSIQLDYKLARAFSDFIFGAQLRYNVLLSKGQDQEINEAWSTWHSKIDKFSKLDLKEILITRLQITNYKLIKFLMDCQQTMKTNEIKRLDELITSRERLLKGDKRSKLYNATDFDYQGWVGIGKLQYRLRNGQNLTADIIEGLGEAHV